jgi:hypothetical protein
MLQAKQKGLDRKDKRESDLCGGIPKQVHYHIKERGTTIQKKSSIVEETTKELLQQKIPTKC